MRMHTVPVQASHVLGHRVAHAVLCVFRPNRPVSSEYAAITTTLPRSTATIRLDRRFLASHLLTGTHFPSTLFSAARPPAYHLSVSHNRTNAIERRQGLFGLKLSQQ